MKSLTRRTLISSACGTLAVASELSEAKGTTSSNSGRPDVKEFGAKGDGLNDDTYAIEEAYRQSNSIYFPPGIYIYNGSGLLAKADFIITGAGAGVSSIVIREEASFVVAREPIRSCRISGLSFVGGNEVIASVHNSDNVSGHKTIEDCKFEAYSSTAVYLAATDEPYWRISRCIFRARSSIGTVGVRLPENSDLSIIEENSFLTNQFHCILPKAALCVRVQFNDFIQFSTETSGVRAALWISPSKTIENSGYGSLIIGNKFGNENQVKGDIPILYANSIDIFGSDSPRPRACVVEHGDYVSGQSIIFNKISGNSGAVDSFVQSYVALTGSSVVEGNIFDGAPVRQVVKFMTARSIDESTRSLKVTNRASDVLRARTTIKSFSGSACQLPLNFNFDTDCSANEYSQLGVLTVPDLDYVPIQEFGPEHWISGPVEVKALYAGSNSSHSSWHYSSFQSNAKLEVYSPTFAITNDAMGPKWLNIELCCSATSASTSISLQLHPAEASAVWRISLLISSRPTKYRLPMPFQALSDNARIVIACSESATLSLGRAQVYRQRHPMQ